MVPGIMICAESLAARVSGPGGVVEQTAIDRSLFTVSTGGQRLLARSQIIEWLMARPTSYSASLWRTLQGYFLWMERSGIRVAPVSRLVSS